MTDLHLSSRSNTLRRFRRSFTMIEMIVVLLIIAIMATMAVPNLGNTQRREFRLAVDQVADLLTMYAQRESLGEKIVGIQHDTQLGTLQLVVLDYDNTNPGAAANWRRDVYVKPVKLPVFMRPEDLEIYADGDFIDTSTWPLST